MSRVRLFALALCVAPAMAVAQQGPTYSKEVSRIFQAKCNGCQRTGDIAPFAINGYDDAACQQLANDYNIAVSQYEDDLNRNDQVNQSRHAKLAATILRQLTDNCFVVY